MKSVRFRVGVDVWECSCGSVTAIGRVCGCGAERRLRGTSAGKTTKPLPKLKTKYPPPGATGYADILTEKNRVERKERKPDKRKLRAPAGVGEFTESCLFRKNAGNGSKKEQ